MLQIAIRGHQGYLRKPPCPFRCSLGRSNSWGCKTLRSGRRCSNGGRTGMVSPLAQAPAVAAEAEAGSPFQGRTWPRRRRLSSWQERHQRGPHHPGPEKSTNWRFLDRVQPCFQSPHPRGGSRYWPRSSPIPLYRKNRQAPGCPREAGLRLQVPVLLGHSPPRCWPTHRARPAAASSGPEWRHDLRGPACRP